MAESTAEPDLPHLGQMLGLLRIHIKHGINLAVCDVRSSDPYVLIKMGNQWKNSFAIEHLKDSLGLLDLSELITDSVVVTQTDPLDSLAVIDSQLVRYVDDIGFAIEHLKDSLGLLDSLVLRTDSAEDHNIGR
ncbi:hypothetical protein K1719_023839 [Acacia pycnantha]|nr:hypothetical protein K1719_023839 [Acacia pycnantha]